jgi:calcineurin-like phosphoesterase family protein
MPGERPAQWLTSDWHLGHRRILELGSGRPFDSVEEHDETLVAWHNELVGADDVVWVLGDVALGEIGRSLANCARMNGQKILVCGNHDRPVMTHDPAKRALWTRRYLTEGKFARVLIADPTVTVPLPGGPGIAASHYPYAGDHPGLPDRFVERRPPDHGGWLLHGHVHDSWRVNGRQINVGVDVWDYRPVRAERILALTR